MRLLAAALIVIALPVFAQKLGDFERKQLEIFFQLPGISEGKPLPEPWRSYWGKRISLAQMVDRGEITETAAVQLDTVNREEAFKVSAAQDEEQRQRVTTEEQAQIARQRAEETARSRAFIGLGLEILRAGQPPAPPPTLPLNCTTTYIGKQAFTSCR